jgi:uncharacterized integral membrane protein
MQFVSRRASLCVISHRIPPNSFNQPFPLGAQASPQRPRIKEHTVRWIHLAVVTLLVAATATFAVQNLEVVTLSFLGFGVRAPVALLSTGVYVLGAITGSSLFALIRRSVQGAVPARTAA